MGIVESKKKCLLCRFTKCDCPPIENVHFAQCHYCPKGWFYDTTRWHKNQVHIHFQGCAKCRQRVPSGDVGTRHICKLLRANPSGLVPYSLSPRTFREAEELHRKCSRAPYEITHNCMNYYPLSSQALRGNTTQGIMTEEFRVRKQIVKDLPLAAEHYSRRYLIRVKDKVLECSYKVLPLDLAKLVACYLVSRAPPPPSE